MDPSTAAQHVTILNIYYIKVNKELGHALSTNKVTYWFCIGCCSKEKQDDGNDDSDDGHIDKPVLYCIWMIPAMWKFRN